MKKFILVYITCPTKKEAKKIAQTLVKEKLAACCNIFPIESFFFWKGKLEKEKEFAIFAKTKKSLFKKIEKRTRELHSYKVPCIIALNLVDGFKEFLNWIESTTTL